MNKKILTDGVIRNLNIDEIITPQTVDVTDFGADPTGKNDSTSAIVMAHSIGKTVYYPDGVYLFNAENLDLAHGVIFESGDGVLIRNSISSDPIIVFDDFGNLIGLRQGHSEGANADSDIRNTSGNLLPPPISKADYCKKADLMVHFYNDFGKESTLHHPGWNGWYHWTWNYHNAGFQGCPDNLTYHAERNPLLGFYRGDDCVVLDWICYWLSEYGAAGVFITAGDLEGWEDPCSSDYWVNQLFCNTPNFSRLMYGMTMPGRFRENPGEESTAETAAELRNNWNRVLEKTYFSGRHTNVYKLRIGNDDYPVMFLFEENYLTYMLDGYNGCEGCRKYLSDLADEFRKHGFPGFVLIIRQRKGRLTDEFAEKLRNCGVYIFTGYYEQGFISPENCLPGTTYGEMVEKTVFPEAFDGRIAHVYTGANTLGPHPSGWDHPGNTPELFEKFLVKAVEYTEKRRVPPLITCYNVSEWSEGGPGLQPNMKDGFGYLDACYNVLVEKDCGEQSEAGSE